MATKYRLPSERVKRYGNKLLLEAIFPDNPELAALGVHVDYPCTAAQLVTAVTTQISDYLTIETESEAVRTEFADKLDTDHILS